MFLKETLVGGGGVLYKFQIIGGEFFKKIKSVVERSDYQSYPPSHRKCSGRALRGRRAKVHTGLRIYIYIYIYIY